MVADEVKEIAEMLLKKARLDLDVISKMFDSGEKFDAILGFHAQQAIEKAIKAVMVYKGLRLVKTHNLRTLIEICEDAGMKAPEISISLERLTRYSVEDRYLEISDEPSEVLNRRELLKDVQRIVDWAEQIVNA